MKIVPATQAAHAARRVSLASTAIPVSVVTKPVHRAVLDQHTSSGGDDRKAYDSSKEHDAPQVAEHDKPTSESDGPHGDGEHPKTASYEHAGKSEPGTHPTETEPTETHPAETHPTETHSAEPQDPPEDPPATTATTTAVVTTPELPAVTVPD
jgi:twinkle protein